jgi:rfaE bifunctional protein kinase chain/domain
MTFNEVADSLVGYVSQFKHRRVLVLGDAILDEYLVGDCGRISPEAPVPVLKVSASKRALGGAANTAANIASLGGHASLIALVGNDDAGRFLRRCASDAGIDLLAVDHGQRTLRKTRVVARQQQIVRLDYEDEQRIFFSIIVSVDHPASPSGGSTGHRRSSPSESRRL